MKNQVTNTIGKLLIVAAFAAVLTGAIFAQKPQRQHSFESSQKAIEQTLRRTKENTKGSAVKKANLAKGFYVSAVNQTNFNLGSDFTIAMIDASYIDSDQAAADSTIVRLVYLIDSLEGKPEAAALQNTLKAVVRRTSNAAKVRLEIENAMKSYSSRLKGEQKWYFDSGLAVTNLVYNAFAGDETAMKKGLSEIQALIKIAPQGTSKEILDPMNILAKYVANTTFAEKDYAAIIDGIIGVVDTINA